MKFPPDLFSRNASLCTNYYISHVLEEPWFILKAVGNCERGLRLTHGHWLPPPPACSFLLWEKSTSRACVSWKFRYIISLLLDALRTYGKLFDETTLTSQTQSKTPYSVIISVLTDRAVHLVFTSNKTWAGTRGPVWLPSPGWLQGPDRHGHRLRSANASPTEFSFRSVVLDHPLLHHMLPFSQHLMGK